MMLGCIPFLLYLPYIYGDVLSISFGMVMFWAVSAYEHYEKKRYIALAACVAGIAVLARKKEGTISAGRVCNSSDGSTDGESGRCNV